jgi:hypothetical protein
MIASQTSAQDVGAHALALVEKAARVAARFGLS